MLGLAVLFWLAEFDVIYSLQDCEPDREYGLHSIPVRFGVASASRLSRCFYVVTVVFLALVGFAAVTFALFWEHRIVSPNDLSRINPAFFDYNAYVSIGHFPATLAGCILNSRSGTAG